MTKFDNIGYHRNPKTTQERKMAQDKSMPYKIRAKRNTNNLPDSYDDIRVSKREDKSWKNKRKTKYK